MENRLPVLIAGAGPTGLLMACELARHGIAFRIIDKKPKRTTTSNATWIQPLTIELLDAMGLAANFVKSGHHCNGIHLHAREKVSIHIPLNQIESIYPYILVLPQSETEQILADFLDSLKLSVERSVELIDVAQNTDNQTITSTLRHADGKLEAVTSNWLIACDGANSTVRNKCKIFFPGEDLPEQFVVADAQMNSFHAHNEIHAFFDKKTVFMVSPLGSNEYRILANIHQSHPRKFFIEKEVREIVSERTYGTYNVHSVSWIFPFWIHSKVIEKMRFGSIFFAGDAAHIHSPASGQGMNAGLQDASNLAWKLALVIRKKANESLLDSYEAERYPVIKDIVSKAEYLTKISLFDKNFIIKMKKFSADHKKKNKINKIASQMTQLNTQYQNSPIIEYNKKSIKKKVKAGTHAPNVRITNKTMLYNSLDSTKHNVLLFTGMVAEKNKQDKLLKLQQWLNKIDPNLINAHIITNKPIKKIDNYIDDTEGLIHRRYNIKYPSIFIVRPDLIIAYYSKKLTRSSLNKFLQIYFNNIIK